MKKTNEITKLPYRCKEVLELYASSTEDVNHLEGLAKVFRKQKILAETYYSHREDLAYVTLVIFLPWTFHLELSKFDSKVFKKWHSKKRVKG